MKLTIVSLAATLALTGAAFATETTKSGPGASSNSPGHEMQDRGSKAGSPGASGYAPGHEMKSGTTGSTGGNTTKSGSGAGTSGSGSSSR
jgi:hypothetical protein